MRGFTVQVSLMMVIDEASNGTKGASFLKKKIPQQPVTELRTLFFLYIINCISRCCSPAVTSLLVAYLSSLNEAINSNGHLYLNDKKPLLLQTDKGSIDLYYVS